MIKNAQAMTKQRKNQIGKTYTVGGAKYKIIAYNQAKRLQDLSKAKTVVVPDTIDVGGNTYMVSELSEFNNNVTKITIGKYVQSAYFPYISRFKKLESHSKYPFERAAIGSYDSMPTILVWEMTFYNVKKSGKPIENGLRQLSPSSGKFVPCWSQKYQGNIKNNLEGKTLITHASQENIIRLGKKCTEKAEEFNHKKYDYYYTNAWNGGIVELPRKVTCYMQLDLSGKETTSMDDYLGRANFGMLYPKKGGGYARSSRDIDSEGYFNGISAPVNLETKRALMYKYRTPNIKVDWDSLVLHYFDSTSSSVYEFDVEAEVYTSDWKQLKSKIKAGFQGSARFAGHIRGKDIKHLKKIEVITSK